MTSGHTTAEGQYLGYSLQLSRLFTLLLEGHSNYSVALECFGDVSVIGAAGVERVDELKSRTSRGNPISDRAVDLWKTLGNWLDLVDSGLDPLSTEFWLWTSKRYPSNFAAKFDSISNPTEATELLAEIDSYFVKHPPRKLLAQHVAAVLRAERRESLTALLPSVRIGYGSGSSVSDLLELMARTVVPEEHRLDVLYALGGWLKFTTDTQLEARQAASIRVDEFHLQLIALVRKFDRQAVLQSYSLPPSGDELEAHTTRAFVRQLQLIDESELMQVRAIHDYLRARAERIQWTARALLHESDFDELERELELAWESKKTIVDIRESHQAESQRGRLLLHECLLHRCRVRGMETPPHFTPGSFHAMADDGLIGWHPQYRNLLGPE